MSLWFCFTWIIHNKLALESTDIRILIFSNFNRSRPDHRSTDTQIPRYIMGMIPRWDQMAIFFVPDTSDTQLVTSSIGSGLSAFCRGLADLRGGVRAAAAEWRRGDFGGFVDHPMDETDDFPWWICGCSSLQRMDETDDFIWFSMDFSESRAKSGHWNLTKTKTVGLLVYS